MTLGGRFGKTENENRNGRPSRAKETKATGSANKSVRKRSADRSALTPRGRELIAYVLNAAALGAHSERCDLETMAADVGLTPARLRTTLGKLSEAGYVTVEGIAEYVYPTVKAIKRVNPSFGAGEAEAFVRRLHRAK
jgi:hypothetical protein